MKTLTLCFFAVAVMMSSCSYHEHEKPAPTVTTQTTSEVTRSSTAYPSATQTTVRETRVLQ